MFQKLKDLYKKYLIKTPLTPFIYFLLNGSVALESKIKRFTLPEVYLRAWKLDMLHGRYEKSTTELFKQIIRPGMAIVDIGAHVGYFTRLFSKRTGRGGRVYACEPDPSNFALLEKNTKHRKNIKVFQLAIGDHAGAIDFFHSELKTGCHSTIPSSFRPTKLTVSSITLDQLCEKERISRVDMIKMDIEGGEVAALRGMTETLKANPHIQIITEFNPECFREAQIEPISFIKQLFELGFIIYAIRPSGKLDLIKVDQTESEIMQNEKFVNIYCTREKL